MNRNIYLQLTFLAILPVLTACQNDDDTPATNGNAIVLGATVVGPETRAGQTGALDYLALAKDNGSGVGFGVFAYGEGIDNQPWTNKQVTHVSEVPTTNPVNDVYLYPGNWSYGDVKDWPKESNKEISFFAYAPFVGTSDYSSPGITAVTDSSTDPTVTYAVGTKPSECVDLLWGVNGSTGLPWLNATRETTGGTVLFTFRHACAAIGFHAQAMVDKDNNLADLTDKHDATGLLGTDCKVTIKSITLTRASGTFSSGGTLNLNNTTSKQPRWTPTSGSSTTLTLSESEEIATDLFDQGDKSPSNMTNPGVTATANSQLIIAKNSDDKEQLFFLIPEETPISYDCTVEYYVTYVNPSAGGYTRLEYTGVNAGTATITGLPLEAGVKYYINLVFSLHTLSVDVTATDWTDTPVDIDVKVEHGTSASSSLSRSQARISQ